MIYYLLLLLLLFNINIHCYQCYQSSFIAKKNIYQGLVYDLLPESSLRTKQLSIMYQTLSRWGGCFTCTELQLHSHAVQLSWLPCAMLQSPALEWMETIKMEDGGGPSCTRVLRADQQVEWCIDRGFHPQFWNDIDIHGERHFPQPNS